jgi:hypothetical protein
VHCRNSDRPLGRFGLRATSAFPDHARPEDK